MTITEQARAIAEEILYELDHRWFGSVSERRKDAVAAIITKHVHQVTAIECIEEVKRLRDEADKHASRDAVWAWQKEAYEHAIERLQSLQGKAGVSEQEDSILHALRLCMSRAQVDRMHELSRQGFTGTIHDAYAQGLMPDEFEPARAILYPAATTPSSVEAPQCEHGVALNMECLNCTEEYIARRPEPQSLRVCVKCGHNAKSAYDGRCMELVGSGTYGADNCGCKCVRFSTVNLIVDR